MSDERDYQAEFDALANVPDEPAQAQPTATPAAPQTPEPEVGTSETARSFAQSGVFADLVAQQQQEREAARKRAIEESQGYTFQGLREAAHKTLTAIGNELPEHMPGKGLTQALTGLAAPQGKAGVLGDTFGMLSPEDRVKEGQAELEFREKSAPFTRGIADSMPSEWTHKASEDRMAEARADVEMGHTVRGYAKMATEYSPTRWLQRFLKGSANSVAERQENALKAAQAMARGEVAFPEKTWWRDRVETGAATIANFSSASLIQYAGIALGYAGRAGLIDEYAAPLDPWDNKITKFGRDLEKYVNELFPGDKARQYEFAKMATQGVASTIAIGGTAKMINGLLGGGATGINAAVSLAGAAALTPEQFGKVTEAMKKGNATELDRLLVFLGNSALGSTERIGLAPMIAGRGVTGARAGAGGLLKEGLDEGLQEMGQQYGQNQLTRATYDPKQDPYEGVAEGGAIGFLTGGAFGAVYSQIRGQVEAQEALAKAKGLGFEPAEKPVRVARAKGGTRTDYEPTLPMPSDTPPEPQSGAPAAPAPVGPPPVPQAPAGQQPPPIPPAQAPAATPPPVPPAAAVPPIATQIPEPDVAATPATRPRPQRTPPPVPTDAAPEAPATTQPATAEPAVTLPPDVAEFIAKTAPELAQRYGLEIPGLTAPPAAEAPAPEQVIALGTPRKITTPDGSMEVDATPEIVELDSLRLASGALQPRDRSRAESDVGIRERAAALDPARLMPGRVSDNGAPMVAADGTILSGNGRALSLAQAYRDPALKAQADSYRAALGPTAAGFREPVLVSRLQPMAQADMVRFADLSNRPAVAAMSATERAVRDARAASDDIMGLYQGGAFTSPQNRAFFQAFNNQVVSSAERGAISRNGMLTKEGEDRMSAAVLAAAYGDPELLARMLESADDTIRSITGALRDAAGAFIRLKAAIRRGEADAQFDISPQVAETARTIARLRETGTRPDAFLDQQDAFNPTDPIVAGLIRAFYNDNLSRQLGREKLTELLNAYAEEAAKHRAEGLIPDETSVEDIVRYARGRALGGAGADQGDLLAGSTSAPGGPDAGPGRAAAGPADAAGGSADTSRGGASGTQGTRSRLGKGLSEIAAQSTGQAQAVERISEGARQAPPPLPSTDQPQDTQPAADLTPQFEEILAGKAPRAAWAQMLGIDEAALEPLIDDAVAKGLLRVDRNGAVKRTSAAKPVPSMAARAVREPETISVPADLRLESAIRSTQAETGQIITGAVRVWAEALEAARGTPEFGPLLDRLVAAAKAGEITKSGALQLAHLVGYKPGPKTTKGEALASIEQRNADLEASRAMQAATDMVLASMRGMAAAAPRRAQGLPLAVDPPLASYTRDADIKAHPDYAAAKAGDVEAAARFVPDIVKPETIEAAARRFGADAIYVPVIAEEAGGRNKIPEMTAHFYAENTGARVADDIIQVSRAFHTGARPMDRLVSRPLFDGEVEQGGKYVLVDDVSVMGGTIAELANFIQSKGGQVAGVVTLVNASRNGVYAAKPEQIRKIEARYGDTVRQEFGVEPTALTADEAQYILNFRDADALRGAVSKGRGERNERLRAKGVRTPASESTAGGVASFGPIGQALFSVSPRVRNARFKAEQERVVARIRDEVLRMVPPGVTTRIMDHITVKGVPYNGYYEHANRLLALSLLSGEDTMVRTLRHEMVHIAREFGLFTSAEWQTLLDRAKKLNIDAQITMIQGGKEVSALPYYRQMYSARFANLAVPQAMIDAKIEEFLNQERVAKLAELYDGGTKFGAVVDRLLARIRDFFNAVRRALNMEGYVTADDIFEKMVSGEIADRARKPEQVQAEIDALFDADPTDADTLIASAEGQVALQEARRYRENALLNSVSGQALFAIAGVKGARRIANAGHPEILRAFQNAQRLADSGTSPEAIWRSAGWMQGPEGKWRFEIDDSKAKITPPKAPKVKTWKDRVFSMFRVGRGTSASTPRLGSILDHPALYAAYPSLKDLRVRFSDTGADGSASFTRKLDGTLLMYPLTIRSDIVRDPQRLRHVLLHEVQHYIQEIEGFASGSAPNREGRPQSSKRAATMPILSVGTGAMMARAEDNYSSLFATSQGESLVVEYMAKREAGDEAAAKDIYRQIIQLARVGSDDYMRAAGEQESELVAARADMSAQERRLSMPELSGFVGEPTQDPAVVMDELYRRAGFRERRNQREAVPVPGTDLLMTRQEDVRWSRGVRSTLHDRLEFTRKGSDDVLVSGALFFGEGESAPNLHLSIEDEGAAVSVDDLRKVVDYARRTFNVPGVQVDASEMPFEQLKTWYEVDPTTVMDDMRLYMNVVRDAVKSEIGAQYDVGMVDANSTFYLMRNGEEVWDGRSSAPEDQAALEKFREIYIEYVPVKSTAHDVVGTDRAIRKDAMWSEYITNAGGPIGVRLDRDPEARDEVDALPTPLLASIAGTSDSDTDTDLFPFEGGEGRIESRSTGDGRQMRIYRVGGASVVTTEQTDGSWAATSFAVAPEAKDPTLVGRLLDAAEADLGRALSADGWLSARQQVAATGDLSGHTAAGETAQGVVGSPKAQALAKAVAAQAETISESQTPTLFSVARAPMEDKGPSEGASQRRDLDALGFYSAALEAAKALKQAKGTPEQMRAMLRSGGAKEAELLATGLDKWLAERARAVSGEEAGRIDSSAPPAQGNGDRTERQPDNRRSREPMVTRDEIVAFLEENRVRVQEATYRAEFTVRAERGDWVEGFYSYEDAEAYAAELRAQDGKSFYVEEEEERQPKWQSYSIDPANPTYRETVIHLPERTDTAVAARMEALEAEHRALTRKLDEIGWSKNSPEKARLDALDAEARELHRAMGEVASSNFRDMHWEEPNPVGHIRSQIIVSADGKKHLNGDNIQSAWQQAYRNMIRDGMALEMYNTPFNVLMDEEKAAVSKEIARRRKGKESLPGGRDEAKIAEMRKRYEEARADTNRVVKAVEEFLAENRSHIPDAQKMVRENNPYHQLPFGDAAPLEALMNYGPREVSEQAKTLWEAWDASGADESRLRAELRTAERAETVPAHPLIEVTDTNLTFMLKRFLRQAVEAGVDGISFTPGHVLSSRGEGDNNPAAMAKWMDQTVPRAMRDLLRTYDRSTRDHVDQSMKSPVDERTFTQRDEAKILRPEQEPPIQFHTFPLTHAVKLAVLSEGQPLFSVAGKPPASPPSGGSLSGEGPGLGSDPQGLTSIIADLKDAIGMPVTQGLSTLEVRDAANNRTWRFRPKKVIRGQYETPAGVARVRLSTDIETLAHEGGHHIERLLGTQVQDLMTKHSTELAVYGGSVMATPSTQLSEDFAEWFADYVLEPDRAKQTAPQFHEGFEALMDAERPDLLEMLDAVQLATMSQAYRDYLKADSLERMRADLESEAPRPFLQRVRRFLAEIGQDGTISGMASQVYEMGIDEQHPHHLFVRKFLEHADRNKLTDSEGRAISLAVHENPYKIMRSVGDAFKTGLRWIQDGVPHYRHADSGFDIVSAQGKVLAMVETMDEAQQMLATAGRGAKIQPRKGHRSASLHDALSLAFGKHWDFKAYQNFGGYLESRRAVEEWKAWDAKLAKIADLKQSLKDTQDRASAAREDLAKARAMMARRQAKTTAGEALLAEFNRTLQRLINAEAADVAIMSDPASTDLQVENAQQRLKVTRRELNRYEQKYQAEAARTVGAYTDQFKIDPQIGLLQAGIAAGEDAALAIRKELRELSEKGVQRPPHRIKQAEHEVRLARLEKANPQFAQAAEMVYDFLWQSAVHDYEAGRLTKAELDYRETRRHFYVPFARSVKELEARGLMASGRGFGGRQPKFAKDKAFKGSDRAVINPIETIIDQTFHRAAATHLNDAMKAYAELTDKVGPGAGALGERVTKTAVIEANAESFRLLEQNLMRLGYTEEDAKEQVKRIESDFGDTQLLLQFDSTVAGPAKPLNVTFWENGERKLLRINDLELAKGIFDSVNGVGREMSNLIMDVVAKPATLLRTGVVTNPAFIGFNIIRDAWSAWIVTGSVLNPKTWPGVTQMRGLYHELAQTDMARLYQEVAGLMGGQNVAALSKVRDKADIFALRERGLHIRPVRMLVAGAAGGAAGFALGGPAGAGFGTLFGMGLHRADVTAPFKRGIRTNFTETIAHVADMSETATRLGVFTEAYNAALKYNPNLTPFEAAQEAAYVARDLIDFGRRGSRMLAAARIVPFLNPALQGLDKSVRTILARSDRGMEVSTTKLMGVIAAGAGAGFAVGGPVGSAIGGTVAPALATNLAARINVVRALLAPFTKKDMGLPLSADEERALGQSAKAWVNLIMYTALLSAVPLLYTRMRYDDDDENDKTAREYQMINEKVKFKATPFKINDEWFIVPKAFEWAVPSNIIEAAIDARYGNDPRFWERVREGLDDVLSPPGIPQAVRLWSDIRTNYNSLSKRPLVADRQRVLPPEEQFNAYASQFAINLSRNVNQSPIMKAAVESAGSRLFANKFELTPAVIDYALRTGYGFWGKDIQKTSNTFREGGPLSAKFSEYPLIGTTVGRFQLDPYEKSDAKQAYFDRMGRFAEGFPRAAAGFTHKLENYGPVEANQFLATLQEEERAYALVEAGRSRLDKRMHPYNRLKGVVDSVTDIQRDLALNRLANTESRKDPEVIVLSPAKRDEIQELLNQVIAIEAENTMIAMKHKQFADRTPLPVEPVMKTLEASDKRVADELALRMQRKKVQAFDDVTREWPAKKAELLRDWQDSVDAGEPLDNIRAKRIVKPTQGLSAPEPKAPPAMMPRRSMGITPRSMEQEAAPQ